MKIMKTIHHEHSIYLKPNIVQLILQHEKCELRIPMKPQPISFGKAYIFKKSIYAANALYKSCPYNIGDILYIQETWGKLPHWESNDSENCKDCENCKHCRTKNFVYKALTPDADIQWKSPKTMPHEAARIFLQITERKAEQLQNISDEDAKKEGCRDSLSTALGFPSVWNQTIPKTKHQLYSWHINPFVWVLDFHIMEKSTNKKNNN